jgi:hypothetical protein
MDTSLRLGLRRRRRLLRGCELALFALLLALAAAAAGVGAGGAGDDPLQCGKAQSSPIVMTR